MEPIAWHVNVKSLRDFGFTGFQTIGVLRETKLSDVPKSRGVYVVLRENSDDPVFLQTSTGGWFKGKNPTVDQVDLHSNWVKGSPVVYIGKAGSSTGQATLRSRLNQYFQFGAGKAIGHWGGRYIWHLPESHQLVVGWMPTPNEEPVTVEQRLIREFSSIHSARPFANLRD